MMKGYILKRLLRSVISILVIMFIVFTLIFTSIPRENIFFYNTWKKLGYLDYVRLNDYCLELYEAGSEEIQKAVEPDSPEAANFVELYQSRGYNIGYFSVSKRPFAYRDVPIFQRLWNWFSNLVQIDHVNRVQDPNNPDLERKIYFGRTPTSGK